MLAVPVLNESFEGVRFEFWTAIAHHYLRNTKFCKNAFQQVNNDGRLLIRKRVYVKEVGGVVGDNHVKLTVQVEYVCSSFGP